MNSQTVLRISAIMGFLAVALGAFGAHGLHDLLVKNERLATWDTAVLYHLTHAIVLLVVATLQPFRRVAWWLMFAGVLVASFAVLGWIGTRIYQEMPPLPDRVVTTAGDEIVASGEIAKGQNVWQSMGGMEVGSVWGHGSYVAPDWTADWLHR